MKWHFAALVVLGSLLEAIFLVVAGLSTAHGAAGLLVVCLLAGLAVFTVAIAIATRGRPTPWTVLLIVGFAFVFRVTLVPVEGRPWFPDSDAYRYLWDGGVTANGFNPYRYAPRQILDEAPTSDARLQALRDLAKREPYARVLHEVTYPSVPTIYPPATQLMFGVASLIAPGRLWAWKSVLMVFDGLTIVWIALTLKEAGRRIEWTIVYAWCPLVVTEFAYAGHHDAVAVCFAALAAYLLIRGKAWGAGAALGTAIAAKVFPAVLIPLFISRLGWRCAAAAALAGAALTAPFAGAGPMLWRGLAVYAGGWRFNAGLFEVIDRIAPTNASARLAAGLGVLAISVWSARRGGEPFARMLAAVVALLALSPVLDPWYVTWIVPFLCVVPFWPLILLTGTIALHYTYFVEFRHPWWAKPLEFAPVAVGLAVELVRWRLRARFRDHPGPERRGGDHQGHRGDSPEPGS